MRASNVVHRLGRITLNWVGRRVGIEDNTYSYLLALRLCQWPLRAATRPILRLFPRDRALVAFGCVSDRFADNPAYAFIACIAHPDLRPVWITGSRQNVATVREAGGRAELRWSPRGIWTCLRAGWYVYGWERSDINLWLADGAEALNLWHGVGVKRIQRNRLGAGAFLYHAPSRSLIARIFADDRQSPDWVLSTSPGVTEAFSADFGVPSDHCIELGYPRNEHLEAGGDAPDALVDRDIIARIAGRTVVGYFPTYRDDLPSVPGGAPLIVELAEIVGSQGAVLLFKPHISSKISLESSESLIALPGDCDLNAYLGLCRVLITDYSSVASDFLLTGRPVVIFVPDYNEFSTTRGFSLDPRTYTPGTLATSERELVDLVGQLEDLQVPANEAMLREFYWPSGCIGAGLRISEFIATDGKA